MWDGVEVQDRVLLHTLNLPIFSRNCVRNKYQSFYFDSVCTHSGHIANSFLDPILGYITELAFLIK